MYECILFAFGFDEAVPFYVVIRLHGSPVAPVAGRHILPPSGAARHLLSAGLALRFVVDRIVLHDVVLVEPLRSNQIGSVHKYVFATTVRRDKAVALVVVPELHHSLGRHCSGGP